MFSGIFVVIFVHSAILSYKRGQGKSYYNKVL